MIRKGSVVLLSRYTAASPKLGSAEGKRAIPISVA